MGLPPIAHSATGGNCDLYYSNSSFRRRPESSFAFRKTCVIWHYYTNKNALRFCHPKRSKIAMSRIRGFAQSKGSSFIKVLAAMLDFIIDWIATSHSFGLAPPRKLNSFTRNDKKCVAPGDYGSMMGYQCGVPSSSWTS
ncbi:MAG: hypothetical protein MJ164_03765, partial [Alphaproteobacteria bacterium]|nr:hypothetical protein [Alphaproteobacteria bacterium]